MKKILFVLIFVGTIAHAQDFIRVSYSTAFGTGIDMGSPASNPFIWQIIGSYNFNEHVSAGIGSGVSLYEKPIIPLFADVKFKVRKQGKFIPFIEFGAGYGIATSDNTNGGIYINPSIGVSYSVYKRTKLFIAAGYESQKMELLKRYENNLISVEFAEKLRHNLISVKVGVEF
jgi:hypothetical protein